MPFQPSDLTGLKLWLKADAITGLNDGDSVTTWNDSSGLSNNAAQGTAANKPVYKTNIRNGNPVVRFDGSNDFLLTPSISIGTFTAFAVFKATTSSPVYEQGISTGSASGFHLWTGITTMRVNKSTVASAKNHSGGATWATDGAWRMTSQTYNGTHATFLLWVNGSAATTSDVTIANPGTAAINSPIYLGMRGGATNALNGDLAEIILYDSSLSTANRQSVEAYLNQKYFSNVTAEVLSGTFSIPAPTVSSVIPVTGNPIGLLLALTYDLSVPANVNAGVVSGTFSIPSPTVTGAANYAGATISSTFSIPSPTLTGAANTDAGVLSAGFTIPAATGSALANVSAGVVTGSFILLAPNLSSGANLSPDALSASFSVASPTVTGGSQVSAGAISATFTVPSPTLQGGANITASVVISAFSIPAPTIEIFGLVLTDVIAGTFSVLSPTLTAGVNITAGVQAITIGIPTPSVTDGRVWTPVPKATTLWTPPSKPTTNWTPSSKPTSIWTPVTKPPLES